MKKWITYEVLKVRSHNEECISVGDIIELNFDHFDGTELYNRTTGKRYIGFGFQWEDLKKIS